MVNRPEGEEIDGEWVIDDQGEAERDAAARQEIEQKRQEALDQAAQRVQQAVEAAISRDDEDERRALAEKARVIDAMRRQEAESGQPPRSISEIEQEMQLLKEIQEEDPPVPPENGEGTPEGEPDPGGSSDGGEDGGEGDGGGGGESEIVEPEEMLAPDEEDRPRPE